MTLAALLKGMLTGLILVWAIITASAVLGIFLAAASRLLSRWAHHG